MGNPLLLWEVAKLHQRDIVKEIALRDIAKQAKTTRLGAIKRLIRLRFALKQNGSRAKVGDAVSAERPVLRAKA